MFITLLKRLSYTFSFTCTLPTIALIIYAVFRLLNYAFSMGYSPEMGFWQVVAGWFGLTLAIAAVTGITFALRAIFDEDF